MGTIIQSTLITDKKRRLREAKTEMTTFAMEEERWSTEKKDVKTEGNLGKEWREKEGDEWGTLLDKKIEMRLCHQFYMKRWSS